MQMERKKMQKERSTNKVSCQRQQPYLLYKFYGKKGKKEAANYKVVKEVMKRKFHYFFM
jgi:hypothetical protein